MTSYITHTQVIKSAWAVFLIVIAAAGFSFKIFASQSNMLGSMETEIAREVEYRKTHALSIQNNLSSITELQITDGIRANESKYMMNMLEMLLEHERLPLPNKAEQ